MERVTHGQRLVGQFGAHDSCSLAANKLGSRGWITLGEWDQTVRGCGVGKRGRELEGCGRHNYVRRG